jgi:hypothetical protein
MVMPEMNGRDLARKLQVVYPKIKTCSCRLCRRYT